MSNDEKYQKAEDAVMALFEDRSVTPKKTEDNLYALISEIEILLSALGSDENDEADNEDSD